MLLKHAHGPGLALLAAAHAIGEFDGRPPNVAGTTATTPISGISGKVERLPRLSTIYISSAIG